LCAPGQGFGKCFNIKNSSTTTTSTTSSSSTSTSTSTSSATTTTTMHDSRCDALVHEAANWCPDVGMTKQCSYPLDKTTDLCSREK
jgi:hypothetical protein